MKKTIACLLALLTILLLCASCGKKEIDPDEAANAVLTDSNVPLDLGATLKTITGSTTAAASGSETTGQ